jgi:hypothetical protein
VLDQRRRAKNVKAPVPPILPDDPRVRDLVVPARYLGAYDALARACKKNHDQENGDE